MQFKHYIEIDDDTTYGAVQDLREALTQHGTVSEVKVTLDQAGTRVARRYVEFTWEYESNVSKLANFRTKNWMLQAVTGASSTAVAAIIDSYLLLQEHWEEIADEINRFDFNVSSPTVTNSDRIILREGR